MQKILPAVSFAGVPYCTPASAFSFPATANLIVLFIDISEIVCKALKLLDEF